MKKLIIVVLVLVMLVSILALPAAANVQPRYPVLACDCGGTAKPVYSGGAIVRYVCNSCGAVYYPK